MKTITPNISNFSIKEKIPCLFSNLITLSLLCIKIKFQKNKKNINQLKLETNTKWDIEELLPIMFNLLLLFPLYNLQLPPIIMEYI